MIVTMVKINFRKIVFPFFLLFLFTFICLNNSYSKRVQNTAIEDEDLVLNNKIAEPNLLVVIPGNVNRRSYWLGGTYPVVGSWRSRADNSFISKLCGSNGVRLVDKGTTVGDGLSYASSIYSCAVSLSLHGYDGYNHEQHRWGQENRLMDYIIRDREETRSSSSYDLNTEREIIANDHPAVLSGSTLLSITDRRKSFVDLHKEICRVDDTLLSTVNDNAKPHQRCKIPTPIDNECYSEASVRANGDVVTVGADHMPCCYSIPGNDPVLVRHGTPVSIFSWFDGDRENNVNSWKVVDSIGNTVTNSSGNNAQVSVCRVPSEIRAMQNILIDSVGASQCPSDEYCRFTDSTAVDKPYSPYGAWDSRCTDTRFIDAVSGKYSHWECMNTKQKMVYGPYYGPGYNCGCREQCNGVLTGSCYSGCVSRCDGKPINGRDDTSAYLSEMYDFLDADDTIKRAMCKEATGDDDLLDTNDHPEVQSDGDTMDCWTYLNTPFRETYKYVSGLTGNPAHDPPQILPLVASEEGKHGCYPSGGTNNCRMEDFINEADADELGVRMKLLVSGGSNFANSDAAKNKSCNYGRSAYKAIMGNTNADPTMLSTDDGHTDGTGLAHFWNSLENLANSSQSACHMEQNLKGEDTLAMSNVIALHHYAWTRDNLSIYLYSPYFYSLLRGYEQEAYSLTTGSISSTDRGLKDVWRLLIEQYRTDFLSDYSYDFVLGLDDEYIGTSVLNTANEDVREVPVKLVPSHGRVMCRADSVPYAKYIPELTRELTDSTDILNSSGKFGDLEYLNLHRTMIPYNELGEPRNKIKRIVSDLVGGGVCNNNGAVCTNDGNLPCESDTSGTAGTCNTYSLCDDPNFQNLIESVSPGSGADADSCKLALNLLVGTFISGAKFATIDPALGRFDSDTGYSIFIGLLRITYELGDPANRIPRIIGTPVAEAVERFIDLLDIGSITAFRSDIEDFQKERVGLDARKKWTLCPVHNTQLGGNIIEKDALAAFNDFMQNDSSLACRQQFTVLLATNVVQPNMIDPKLISNSLRLNRRTTIYPYENIIPNEERLNQSSLSLRSSNSSLQAVANLRTKFVRDPVTINGATVPKEIFTFVVDVSGIAKPTYIQQLMALTGGTHTSGLIRHNGPAGISVGSIDANSVLPKDVDSTKKGILAKVAEGGIIGSVINKLECIDNDGSHKNTGDITAPYYGACQFGSDKVFGDDYYAGDDRIEIRHNSSFAFSSGANNLSNTLNSIINSIKQFTVTNTPPVIPGVAKPELQDRVYLTVSQPADITQRHLWQGRLAQYRYEMGEVRDKDGMTVVSIGTGGQINRTNALNYVWEAGNQLSLRDINSEPRKVITVLEDPIDGLYSGAIKDIDDSLTASNFGITADDVSRYGPHHGCSGSADCLKDKIISFLQGNTGILYDRSGADVDSFGDLCGIDPMLHYTPGKPSGQCELRLGGIFHSEPKVVGSPSQFFQGINFQTFRRDYNERPAVVYVGGNDGGLHAFHAGDYDTSEQKYDDGTGKELFFYVPPTFLRSPLRVGDGNSFSDGSTITTNSLGDDILSLEIDGDDFTVGDRLRSIQDIKYGKIKDFVLDSPVFQENYAFFDGTPTIKDVFIDGYWNGIGALPTIPGQIESGEWHTILVSGFRNGGSGITALDITNPPSENGVAISSLPYPVHLWTFTDEDMGNSWSSPVIAKVRLDTGVAQSPPGVTVDRWVVFVGGGIDPDATNIGSVNEGNAFYAIDLPTGKLLYKFHPTRSQNDTHSSIEIDITLTGFDSHRSRMVCELASDPGVFDTNADGYADEVYIGDTCGQLWKFDVSQPLTTEDNIGDTEVSLDSNTNKVDDTSGDIAAGDWTGRVVFCADCASTPPTDYTNPANDIKLKRAHSPIYYPPVLVPDFNGDRHVVFQTGDRRYPTSNDVNSKGRLYSVKSSSFISTSSIPTERTIGSFREVRLQKNTGGDIEVFEIVDIDSGNLAGLLSGNFVVKYPGAYEKGVGTPFVSNRVLTFTSYDPTIQQSSGNICEQSSIGRSRLYQLNYATGEAAIIPDPNNSSSSSQSSLAGRDIGGGIPSTPNVSVTDNGGLLLGISTSGGGAGQEINSEYSSVELPSLSTSVREVFWQEIW